MHAKQFGMAALGCSVALAAAATLGPGCHSSPAAAGLASQCSINSDCDDPLICAFARCHNECKASRDCPMGERCLLMGTIGVCQLPMETMCNATMPCPSGSMLVCAGDDQCRNQCASNGQCGPMQTCLPNQAPGTGACFDNSELEGGVPPGGDGGSMDGTTDSPGGGGDGSGDSSDTGVGPTCPNPQTQFGNIAMGDVNPGFTSGVGARTPSQLLIFTSYVPAADSGVDAGTGNEAYVQAFDPVTGASRGPASPFFAVPDGSGFGFDDVSIAPTGQMVLLFHYGQGHVFLNNPEATSLYAAFLAPSEDAGAIGLQLGPIVKLATDTIYGQPHAVWSVGLQAFVLSWEYKSPSSGYWLIRVTKALADGQSTVGIADAIPTDYSGNAVNGSNIEQGGVGMVGSLVGAAYLNANGQYPYITVLDPSGIAVGSPTPLASNGAYWVAPVGVPAGFLTFYDNRAGAAAVLLPTSPDGGVMFPAPTDGGDAGGLPRFDFTGSTTAYTARTANDDTGGANGAGVLVFFPDGASFAYVNADGMTHTGLGTLFPNTYAAGDMVTLSNFRGSFVASLFSTAMQSAQAVASGCQ